MMKSKLLLTVAACLTSCFLSAKVPSTFVKATEAIKDSTEQSTELLSSANLRRASFIAAPIVAIINHLAFRNDIALRFFGQIIGWSPIALAIASRCVDAEGGSIERCNKDWFITQWFKIGGLQFLTAVLCLSVDGKTRTKMLAAFDQAMAQAQANSNRDFRY